MSIAQDVEVVRAVLRRYSIERVSKAAVTPDMALGAVDRIVAALEVLQEISDDVEEYPSVDNRNRTLVDVDLINRVHDVMKMGGGL